MNANNQSSVQARVAPGAWAVAAALVLMGAVAPASGDAQRSTPYLRGELSIELQNDWNYDSEDRDVEGNDFFTTTEPYLVLQLTPNISVHALGVLEPVRDRGSREDRFLEDHGIYLEHLTANYDTDRWSVYAGKFTPNFGRAWDIAPGIYGTDFAGDYELSERVGLGGAFTFEASGRHTLSASTFVLDTSFLSDSAFTSRGRTRRADGGPANTGNLSSFAIGIDGEELDALPGVSYHAAYARQDVDGAGTAAEDAIVLGLSWDGDIAPATLTLGVEYARFDDLGGARGDGGHYLTAYAQATRGPWNIALSTTLRDLEVAGVDSDDFLFQASAGYEFDSGLTFDVGWRHAREDDVETQSVGFLATYGFEF